MGIVQPKQTYGRLTVTAEAPKRKYLRYWYCVCSCGARAEVCQTNLRNGHTQSCGCWKRAKALGNKHAVIHGDSRSPEWISWSGMHDRCRFVARYKNRGIKVCKRWLRYENFLADMGRRPSLKHSLDRWPDNNGDYKPSNCRWATASQQQNHKSNTRKVLYEGKLYTPMEIQQLLGIPFATIKSRMNRGVVGEALFSLVHAQSHRPLNLVS